MKWDVNAELIALVIMIIFWVAVLTVRVDGSDNMPYICIDNNQPTEELKVILFDIQ